ncbi:MAG: hypothetical protein J1E06_01240 [Acutalibacter sp.]|nr:hypothetical protein [Acutalibacter sp.]
MKKLLSFLAGMLTAVMLSMAVVPALAAGGGVEYGQVGIRFFGKQKVEAGDLYAAPNGQQVPSSITYIDAAGGKTNYLSIRQLSELFGVDIRWDASAQSVEIGSAGTGGINDVAISTGTGEAPKRGISEKPQFGQKIGAFEEIDPSTVSELKDTGEVPVSYLKDTRVQYQYYGFPEYTVDVSSEHGQYLIYTVTNNGQKEQYTMVAHKNIGGNSRELFSSVLVQPGETVVRAFRVDKNANPLDYSLTFGVGGTIDFDLGTDVTVSLEQYH